MGIRMTIIDDGTFTKYRGPNMKYIMGLVEEKYESSGKRSKRKKKR